MKRLDSCVPNFLAISIASLITTFGGASHPVEIPVLGVLRDDAIRFRLVLLGATDEHVGKAARVAVDGVTAPELVGVRRRIVLAVDVELIQELERDFAGFATSTHGAPWR